MTTSKKSDSMSKQELVSLLAERTGNTKTDTTNILDTLLTIIKEALKEDKKVKILGFGSFQTSYRKATTGRNPSTQEEIAIPASIVPKFKAGQSLKDFVNGK